MNELLELYKRFFGDHIRGWVEILHYGAHEKRIWRFEDLDPNDYEMVGSPLPLEEYRSVFEVYEQFAQNVPEDFGIPREFRRFDAINVCAKDFKIIVTLVLVNRKAIYYYKYENVTAQYDPKYDLALIKRRDPFRSVQVPDFGIGKGRDDENLR